MLKLAFRNIFRQKARTVMTLAAIVVSVVGLILSGGFVEDIFLQLGETIIHSQSGHLQIAKKGFFAEGSRHPERYFISDPDAIRQRAAALDGVDDVMARLNFSGLLNNDRTDLSIVGEAIEPDREARLGTYLMITAGRQLSAADHYGILVGQGVARSLQIAPGQHVTLLLSTADGALNALEFEVVGVFQSFSNDYDARTVKIHLDAARELLNTKSANLLVLSLSRTSDSDRVARSLQALFANEGLEVKQWQVLNDFYSKTVALYDRQLAVLRVIILFMVILGVTNAVNMTVYERTGEFGTMRAIGNNSRFVFSVLMTESLFLGLIGVAVGVMLGIVLAMLISLVGIPMPPPPNANIGYTAQIRVLPAVVGSACLVGLAGTVAACVFPALRASRIAIADALRRNL